MAYQDLRAYLSTLEEKGKLKGSGKKSKRTGRLPQFAGSYFSRFLRKEGLRSCLKTSRTFLYQSSLEFWVSPGRSTRLAWRPIRWMESIASGIRPWRSPSLHGSLTVALARKTS